VKKALLLACLLTLCNLTLSAQTRRPPRIVHTPEKSSIHVPPQEAPAGLKMIYSNLGSKTDLYNDLSSWYVAGPGQNGYSEFEAIPFTPKSNSHVSRVEAAIHYFSGANQINLSLYGDANGVPGTLLAGPVTVTNLPAPGTCCTLAVADFTPVAVTAGTQYWIVADTPLTGTGSDFTGGWSFVHKIVPFASGGNFGWFANSANALPAGAALGTTP